MGTALWVDASAGVAGDMLAGALIAAGVPIEVMRCAVDSVVAGLVELDAHEVQRAGLSATRLEVTTLEQDPPHRHLSAILELVEQAALDPSVADAVARVFRRLGEAEAAAHGVDVEEVHFHEVGAADSIADIIAVCAGLHWLAVDDLSFSVLELGHGSVQAAHGRIPVPTPAALRLTEGFRVTSLHSGEMATPTGLALLTALGSQQPMPTMRVLRSGMGAGSRDPEDHPNVVRVVIGEREAGQLLLEANVDDMDPRLWPSAIDSIMRAGARDAWLTPIVMKKGRPALTLSVLCTEVERQAIEEAIFRDTTTIGLRVLYVGKVALERGFTEVKVDGQRIAVKWAGRLGRVYNVSIEWEDVAAAARQLGLPDREVLASATAAAAELGLMPGAEIPAH